MGQILSKKKKLEINEADRAVLTLKTQARKLEQQRTRIHGNIDREMVMATTLVAQGKKDRALLALKRRKLQEGQAAKLDAWLLNVEEMLGNLETTKNQQRLFAALKEGNSAIKQMQKDVPLEDVEKLMQDSADAKEYEDRLRQMLGESLNPEEEDAAAAELEELEAQLVDQHKLELPKVPSAAMPTLPTAAQEKPQQAQQQAQQAAAAAGEGAAAEGAATGEEDGALPELPSAPQTKVQLPAVAEKEEEEREAERVLVEA